MPRPLLLKQTLVAASPEFFTPARWVCYRFKCLGLPWHAAQAATCANRTNALRLCTEPTLNLVPISRRLCNMTGGDANWQRECAAFLQANLDAYNGSAATTAQQLCYQYLPMLFDSDTR